MTAGKVDWSKGKPTGQPYPESLIEIPASVKSGASATLRLSISNKKGRGDCYRHSNRCC
jgi:hypothetical protein